MGGMLLNKRMVDRTSFLFNFQIFICLLGGVEVGGIIGGRMMTSSSG